MKKLVLILPVAMTGPAFAETAKIPPSTPEQVAAFVQADQNDDGALTGSEFRTFIETMADNGSSTAKFIRTFAVHEVAFQRVDADGDGYARPFELYDASVAYESEQTVPTSQAYEK